MSLVRQLRHRVRGLPHRSRGVALFFATSIGARGLGIACQLVQVPIAMAALGPEAFGLWMALSSLGLLITLADFGLGQGAQNKLAEAFAMGRDPVARELWGTAFVCFGLGGVLLAALALPTAYAIDWTALFNLKGPDVQADASAAVAVTLVLCCLNFPLGLAQRLAHSRQQGWQHNLVLAFGSVGGLIGVALAARFHVRLPGLIFAAQAPAVLGQAVLLGWQLARLRWWPPLRTPVRWATLREPLRLGAYFGVQQVQLVLLVALPQVIISTQLGAAAVTPYNLAQRFFNLFAVVQNAFMLPLWPAYSAAKARGEYDWIRRTLRYSLGATALCTLAPMALGAAYAGEFLTAWVGADALLPSTTLIWLLYFWNALLFLQQPFGYLLAGLSEVRRLTFFTVVSAVTAAALMSSLVRRFGQEGVVAGMIVGYLPCLLLGNIAETVRVVRLLPGRPGAAPALAVAPP